MIEQFLKLLKGIKLISILELNQMTQFFDLGSLIWPESNINSFELYRQLGSRTTLFSCIKNKFVKKFNILFHKKQTIIKYIKATSILKRKHFARLSQIHESITCKNNLNGTLLYLHILALIWIRTNTGLNLDKDKSLNICNME